jgi:FkbM family methyltransferase
MSKRNPRLFNYGKFVRETPKRVNNKDQMMNRALLDILSLEELATGDRFALESYCRAQAHPVYLGDHTAICRLLSRYKFYVDTRDRGFGSNVLLDGFWEMWITMFIASTVKAGMVAIDVGANFGYYTLLLGGLVGEAGRVVAIEPNPSTADFLRNSVALNGFASRTTVIEAAVGDVKDVPAILFSPHGEPKNATVILSKDQVNHNLGAIYEVNQVTVDQVVADIGRVDFLKIDAEGAEESIIEGMKESLLVYKPAIILEFNAARCKDPEGLLARLSSAYGEIRFVDYNGKAVNIDGHQVMSERIGEDWLLFFAP